MWFHDLEVCDPKCQLAISGWARGGDSVVAVAWMKDGKPSLIWL